MTNHDRFARVFESRKGRTFSTAEIQKIMKEESDIQYGSILPNDHGAGNKYPCWCVGTRSQIFERLGQGQYRVLHFTHKDEHRDKANIAPAATRAEPKSHNVSKSSSSEAVTADHLGRWRRCLRRVLEGLDGGPDPGRGLKSWIMALSRDGRIPRNVASAMILVAETRNIVEYEAVTLSRAEGMAARSAWSVVMEWAANKRLTLPAECQNTGC